MSALKLYLDGQGNVGIGTSTVSQRLHVGGGDVNVDTGGDFRVNNVPVLTATALGHSVTSSQLQQLGNVSGINVTGNVLVGNTALFVNASSPRVGVGTAAPNYELDVVGDLNVTGSLVDFPVDFPVTSNSTLTLQLNGRDMFPADTADTTSHHRVKWW